MNRRAFVVPAAVPLAGVLLAASGALAQSRVDFATGTRWFPIADTSLSNLTGADFDEDGNLDFAVTAFTPPTIRLLFGDGLGWFLEGAVLPRPGGVGSLSAADFDSDGHEDLAFLGGGSGSAVIVIFGDGSGSFSRQAEVPLPPGLTSGLVPADLDGDGDPDIVVGATGSDSILAAETLSGGAFGVPVASPGGSRPSVGVSGDVDEDGRTDVVVVNSTVQGPVGVSFLAGTGDMGFLAPVAVPTAAGPTALALADWNADAHLDLAVGHFFAGIVTVSDGNGSGVFGASRTVASSLFEPRGLLATDIGNDGRMDLVFPANRSDVVILDGDGVGGFAVRHVPTGDDPIVVVAADLDRDGHRDLSVLNRSSKDLNVVLGPSFAAAPAFPSGTGRVFNVAIADFMEDGRPDVVSGGFSTSGFSLLVGDGQGAFGAPVRIETGDTNSGVATADFDGDGRSDLVVTNSSRDSVGVYLGDGAGAFSLFQEISVGIAPNDLVVADFNGDAIPDVAVANDGSGCPFPDCSFDASVSILVGRGDGGLAAMPAISGAWSFMNALLPGDFDGDGNEDLVVCATRLGTVLFIGDGAGGFSPGPTVSTDTRFEELAAGFFDDGSTLDLAGCLRVAGADGEVLVFLGAGDGTFSAPASFAARHDPRGIVAADLDADGDVDLAVSNADNDIERDAVSVYSNDGAGAFGSARHFGSNRFLSSPTAVDVDGDARLDLVMGAGGGVAVLVNRSSAHLDCRGGRVNGGAGPAVDVLFVNGSAGLGPDRRVDLDTTSSLEIFFAAPPSKTTGPSVFVLGAWRGNPGVGSWRDLPFGLGTICAPTPLTDAAPRGLLVWWNNVGKISVLGAPTRPSAPAPTVVASLPVVGRTITFFLQGVVQDRNAPNGKAAVTNGVLVDVR